MRSGASFASITIAGVLALAACAGPPLAMPDTQEGGNGPVRVAFVEPERFTDIATSPVNASEREANLRELRRPIERRAGARLAEGQGLEVTITDIDMAGQAEPWRARAPEMRIVRDVYPPRIDVRFRLVDGEGMVLRSGQRSLRDPMFMARGGRYDGERLKFEKALLDDWIERVFGSAPGDCGARSGGLGRRPAAARGRKVIPGSAPARAPVR